MSAILEKTGVLSYRKVMQTDRIDVNSNGEGRDRALDEASKFASYIGLNEKDSLTIRLLAEETFGMFTAITEEFTAEYWLENEDGVCRIHLEATTDMDLEKKRDLIDVASDRKNSAYRGFLGSIWESIQNGLYRYNDVERTAMKYGAADDLMMGGLESSGLDVTTVSTFNWSLVDYRSNDGAVGNCDESAREAWDELEKTVIAKIADDVRVAVRGNNVSLIVEKKF